jgi:hypothetical protein
MIEIRNIAETTIERDIQNFFAFHREPRGCIAQARPAHILMRRNSGQALERPQKMTRAQARFSRQPA